MFHPTWELVCKLVPLCCSSPALGILLCCQAHHHGQSQSPVEFCWIFRHSHCTLPSMQSSIAGTLLQVKGCDSLSLSTYVCRYHVLLYAVASTMGAALVFPGAGALDFGTTSLSPPFVTGLSAVFIVCVCAPIIAVSITGIAFLNARNMFARGDDPLHKTLWVRSAMLQLLHALVHQLCKHLLACNLRAHQQASLLPQTCN